MHVEPPSGLHAAAPAPTRPSWLGGAGDAGGAGGDRHHHDGRRQEAEGERDGTDDRPRAG